MFVSFFIVQEVRLMISNEKLERINQLAKKSKEEGLTLKEQTEQKELRQEYLQNVRSSFKNQFKSMTVKDPEGNDVTPQKVRDLQNKNNKH
ncbi:Uncharacterized protein YnzC, UPF0291/DUF896 family [Lentibacillus persicus]|uniref:UPF0291 protein SAMN05216238_10476 n=2 Tax=Lentibacillus persicus TaxID=640948 RepID=A0A1I1V6C7_9BACI|nr:Uncharacterized protein YnzC, UPF0291/DUF896 family [Lentibacillus persicus]